VNNLTQLYLLCCQAPTIAKFRCQCCQIVFNNKRHVTCITNTAGHSRGRFECVTKLPLVTPHAKASSSYSLKVTSFHLMLISCVHIECLKSVSEINIFQCHCGTRMTHCLKISVAATDPLKLSNITHKIENILTAKQCCLHTHQHCLFADISNATTMSKHVFCLVLLLACCPVWPYV
jgi:hypothetical protein